MVVHFMTVYIVVYYSIFSSLYAIESQAECFASPLNCWCEPYVAFDVPLNTPLGMLCTFQSVQLWDQVPKLLQCISRLPGTKASNVVL